MQGWEGYRASDTKGASLGKELGLEGTGGRRIITQLDQEHRDMMLTLEVVHLVETTKDTPDAKSVDKAISKVADRHSDPEVFEDHLVSSDRLWKIYEKNRAVVEKAYRRKARPSQP